MEIMAKLITTYMASLLNLSSTLQILPYTAAFSFFFVLFAPKQIFPRKATTAQKNLRRLLYFIFLTLLTLILVKTIVFLAMGLIFLLFFSH